VPSIRVFRVPLASSGSSVRFSTSTILNRESLGLYVEKTTFANTGPLSAAEQVVRQTALPENRRLVRLIKDAAVGRDWENALTAFREASTPDALLYSVLLHAAERCNRADEAFAIYEKMCRDKVAMGGPNFVALIRLAGRAGQLNRAISFKEDAHAQGVELNAFIYCALVDAHKHARDATGALHVWHEAKAAGVAMTPPLLSSLMSAVAQTGDVSRTEALVREADGQFQPNRIHLNCILHACRHASDADAALRIVEDHKARGVNPDVISFTILLSTLRIAGRSIADASGILQQMQDCGVEPDKFFLEEQLSMVIGVNIKRIFEDASVLSECDRPALESAFKLLEEFKNNSKQLSRLSEDVHKQLSAFLSSGTGLPTASADWFRVLQEGQKGPEYFWDRKSGRTQWEHPSGAIVGTVQAASI